MSLQSIYGSALNVVNPALGNLYNQSQSNNGLNYDAVANQASQNYQAVQSVPQYNIDSTTGAATTNPTYTAGQQSLTSSAPTRTTQSQPSYPTPQPTPVNNQALYDALIKGGYSDANARNAANGPNATNLAKEYLQVNGGSTGGTSNKNISKTGDPRAALVTSNPTTNADFNNSGMNIDDYLATIDQEYNNNNSLLDKQAADINAAQPGIEQGITSQADLLKQKAGTVKDDALTAARRLYAELQQGYKQRFGGASSAGEAAMALTGNEQQRQMAQTNRQYQDSVAQVEQSAATAINSAQQEFRNQLLQVQSNRTATENDRLNARRQALQGLSDKVYAIQQQATTFKQNLQLMQEQARLQNEANLKGMNTNPVSGLTTSGLQTAASGNQGLSTAVGSVNTMSSGMSKNTDPLANGVYPIASMPNGQMKYSDGSVR
jgi:hypothetical protein